MATVPSLHSTDFGQKKANLAQNVRIQQAKSFTIQEQESSGRTLAHHLREIVVDGSEAWISYNPFQVGGSLTLQPLGRCTERCILIDQIPLCVLRQAFENLPEIII